MKYADRFAYFFQANRMTVADYYAKYIQLARFAPHSDIPDETARAHKFQRGLNLEYKPYMAMIEGRRLKEVRVAALMLERGTGDVSHRADYRARHGKNDRPGK